MKKSYLMVASLFLCILYGCNQDEALENQLLSDRRNPKGLNQMPEPADPAYADGHCVYTHLIAGQHHIAGSVIVDIDGDNLVITYATTGEWTLGTTHLSLGNCDEDWAPINGGGNPQIGQFEYTEPFSTGPQEVVYVIPLEGLNDNYCFAAHAEVQGPTGGETAWAQGSQFDGNGWAMFVESFLSNCPPDDGDDDGDDP